MASSGAAEKPKFHEGALKPYPHEEHGRQGDVGATCSCLIVSYNLVGFLSDVFLLFLNQGWTSQGSSEILVSL
jgi:hypothetical protein